QRAGDLVPRRLRGDEDVRLRAHAGIVVEEAGGEEHAPVHLTGERRAAAATEGSCTTGGDSVLVDLLLATHPAEPLRRHAEGARERRAVMLAAHRAVAVPHELERRVGLEGDVATQAAAMDRHVPSLAPIAIRCPTRIYLEAGAARPRR